MSAEIYTIIGAAIALAALILNGQATTRRALAELRQEMNGVSTEISGLSKVVAALAERVARLEGVMESRVGA